MSNYQDEIAETWNNINECLTNKTTAISHEDFVKAKNGELKVSLAGVKCVPENWFPPLGEKNILALACGGGQQVPVFVAHGTNVTVTDYSDKQLDSEKYVAERENYNVNIVKADMSKTFSFADSALI